jgi:hypothetical protein
VNSFAGRIEKMTKRKTGQLEASANSAIGLSVRLLTICEMSIPGLKAAFLTFVPYMHQRNISTGWRI